MTIQTIAQLFDLNGRSAIVTGGAMGIGQAIAFRLAEAGASMMIADIDLGAASQTVEQIKARGGKAQAIGADASSLADANSVLLEPPFDSFQPWLVEMPQLGAANNKIGTVAEAPAFGLDQLLSAFLLGRRYQY